MKDLERIIREFVPHSADYCVEGLAKAIQREMMKEKITGILTEFHCPDMMLSQAIGQEVEIKVKGDPHV